jgi:hypothetical protein
MLDNSLNKRFFTNTYVTSSGRENYLRIDHLEDPLFTSFTFDIDYVTSPLFYTINYSDYGYPNVDGLAENIEIALGEMYREYMNPKNDQGYDILPVLSASILDGNKLGFGLQQNVYMDLPLYGATEYIYMVDKRNGGANQNDARFDSNRFPESGGNPNAENSYRLGDSVKTIVNDSDKEWANRQREQNETYVNECQTILDDPNVNRDHEQNRIDMDNAWKACEDNSTYPVEIDGKKVDYTEDQLMKKIDELKKLDEAFEQFKREIVDWANGVLSGYQNRGTAIYNENKCLRKIATIEDISGSNKNRYAEGLEKEFGSDFVKKYLYKGENSYAVKFSKLFSELENDFIGYASKEVVIKQEKIISKFGDKLEYFELYTDSTKRSFKGNVSIYESKNLPEWVPIFWDNASWFTGGKAVEKEYKMSESLMAYQCEMDDSFDENFVSKKIGENDELLGVYEDALENIRVGLYGWDEITQVPRDSSNPSPDSPYGEYLEAKEKYENDDYSQAEKAQALARSGMNEMNNMIGYDEYNQNIADENYNDAIKRDAQPLEVSRDKSIVPSQTVLDMLGFISGMKKMTMSYPYIIQGITGLDTAYNKHYGIKDPYLGSGEDKISLTCLESLDLRVSSMFNRYFNAVYDRQYRRERVPVNLRRFNCSIYVHDVRNFVSKMRVDKYGNQKVTYNRILELTDMYYSVIEFRFYDCEIIPEETGNIFNDISNEAPSEMKKTNFTFTYGNCVVNFVPQSEVAAHNAVSSKNTYELTRN